MRVLIACEESQTITKEFRKLGFECYSCDIKDCIGGYPQWHIKGCALTEAYSNKYDLMIAHPPCTFLSVSGACWMYNKDGSINTDRKKKQDDAIDFVIKLMNAPIKHIAIENPISVISTKIRRPDQTVHPWMFGDSASKSTCFWLKNLPHLIPTNIVDKGEFHVWIDKNGKEKKQPLWYYKAFCDAKTPEERRSLRSKTFLGISEAIATQWSNPINYQLSFFS